MSQTQICNENIRRLVLENDNNRLSCNVFAQITLAPPPMAVTGEPANLIGKKFFIELAGEKVYVELVDYEVNAFMWITNMYTLLTSGLEEKEWKENFKKKFPSTNDYTRMAVYLYKKIVL